MKYIFYVTCIFLLFSQSGFAGRKADDHKIFGWGWSGPQLVVSCPVDKRHLLFNITKRNGRRTPGDSPLFQVEIRDNGHVIEDKKRVTMRPQSLEVFSARS